MKKLACRDVGLDCDFVIEGMSVKEVQDKAHQHAFEIHAIKPEEMTSEMKVKIIENILDT
jgi:predicted small metal-binding protein